MKPALRSTMWSLCLVQSATLSPPAPLTPSTAQPPVPVSPMSTSATWLTTVAMEVTRTWVTATTTDTCSSALNQVNRGPISSPQTRVQISAGSLEAQIVWATPHWLLLLTTLTLISQATSFSCLSTKKEKERRHVCSQSP